MSWNTFLLFAPACFAINLAFGPNNLLSLTYGMRSGVRIATVAALGRLVAFALMILLTAIGLGAVLAASELAFTVVKWVGAAYLVWLGFKILRSAKAGAIETKETSPQRSLSALMAQEFWTAIGNPKAILVFTAFFPQFLDLNAYGASFAVMGVTFLGLEVIAVIFYAVIGWRLGALARTGAVLTWFNRISGSMMIAFGIALAFTRRPA
ncbi:LysE family translocator [Microvirga terricola]|uniref:LysE family translocator n=1 Tax=Microvirga terricola TaxID=2719797 RepID=A0ABX0V6J0_9HYPH|nr:LysE family translocator [Microvirga terricola]NIX75452.1 LysE family translocator [Microvirga terricola]